MWAYQQVSTTCTVYVIAFNQAVPTFIVCGRVVLATVQTCERVVVGYTLGVLCMCLFYT